MTCVHRGEQGDSGYACHSDRLLKVNGFVPVDFCADGVCPYFNRPNRHSAGLGDTVHKVTHALGIDKLLPGCGGCGNRKKRLNQLVPYDGQ